MGKWIRNRSYDGHKYVCLDDFEENKSCLVYSFGLNHETSFEEAMINRGKRCVSINTILRKIIMVP